MCQGVSPGLVGQFERGGTVRPPIADLTQESSLLNARRYRLHNQARWRLAPYPHLMGGPCPHAQAKEMIKACREAGVNL